MLFTGPGLVSLSLFRTVLSVSFALMTNQPSVIERYYCCACYSLLVSVCMCVELFVMLLYKCTKSLDAAVSVLGQCFVLRN